MAKDVILTGLRANSDLHIGNYFGALLPIVNMAVTHADDYQINLFVPDLHSFTTPIDHKKLYSQVKHNLKLYVASGLPINHSNVYIYRQSFIPAHSELTWILDCFSSYGEMARMIQFKEKASALTINSSSEHEYVSVGLFNYPVLMAADILLYSARYVPVGEDQTQHLEFTRHIAQRMNHKFGNIFTIPEPLSKQQSFFGHYQGLKIKDLVEPDKKMSKSANSAKGIIFLGDNPKEAAKKIMSATTDSIGSIKYDPTNQPGISNLIQILAFLSQTPIKDVIAKWQGKTAYGEFKSVVAKEAENFLTSFQAKLSAVNEQQLTEKLEKSEQAMNQQANRILLKVQQAVGLRNYVD